MTLLDRGANVTLVDDSGLTCVDVAKTKKVKNTLRQVHALILPYSSYGFSQERQITIE